jgi:hypothetical protein
VSARTQTSYQIPGVNTWSTSCFSFLASVLPTSTPTSVTLTSSLPCFWSHDWQKKNSATPYLVPLGQPAGQLPRQTDAQMTLCHSTQRPWGRKVPCYLKTSKSGNEDGSLKSGPEKTTGTSLPLVSGVYLRILQDAISLLGSASLVLGIISSIEEVMHFSPKALWSLSRLGENVFSSSVAHWHAQVSTQGVLGETEAECWLLLLGMCSGKEVGFQVVVGMGCGLG